MSLPILELSLQGPQHTLKPASAARELLLLWQLRLWLSREVSHLQPLRLPLSYPSTV